MSPCPVCGGRHLRGLTYQHRIHCRIYSADAATTNHDWTRGTGIRPARTHEEELIREQHYREPDDGQHYGIHYQHSGGFHDRAVVLLDEHDRLASRLEQPDPDSPDAA